MATACRPRGLLTNSLLAVLLLSAVLLTLRHFPRLLAGRDVTVHADVDGAGNQGGDDVIYSYPDYSKLKMPDTEVEWNRGPEVEWNRGMGEEWNGGPEVEWNRGAGVEWNRGMGEEWNGGPEMEWNRGAGVERAGRAGMERDARDRQVFGHLDAKLRLIQQSHLEVTSASPDLHLWAAAPARSGDVTKAGGRWLVYLCDVTQSCGGWGDRQRGIVSTYLLALATRRRFALSMTSPCDLANFFSPNLVQWRDFNVTRFPRRSVRVVNAMGDLSIRSVIRSGSFNQHFPQQVVLLRTNQYLYNYIAKNRKYNRRMPEWSRRVPHHIRFREAWYRLFSPVRDVASERDALLAGGRKLVCAHVRMGRNPTMPNDEHARNSWASLRVLWDFLRGQLQAQRSRDAVQSRDRWRVFVATDSEAVRREAAAIFQHHLVSVPGEIIHIDRQRHAAQACNGFRSAILDQLILASCHVLVASRSGFSVFASYLRPSEERLFIFEEGTVSPFLLP